MIDFTFVHELATHTLDVHCYLSSDGRWYYQLDADPSEYCVGNAAPDEKRSDVIDRVLAHYHSGLVKSVAASFVPLWYPMYMRAVACRDFTPVIASYCRP